MHEHIINNFPLVNYILSKGGKQSKKHEYIMTCPTCGKPKLTVNISKKLWHCWVCAQYTYDTWLQEKKCIQGAGGVLALVMLIEKMDMNNAIQFITKYSAFQLEKLLSFVDLSLDHKEKINNVVEYPEIPFPEYSVKIKYALPYMIKRQISMLDVERFKLFVCNGGRYANRIIFPVYDTNGLICFQGRAMFKESLGVKYVKALAPSYLPGYARTSDVLFNLDQASTYKKVCLCEGPISAIHTGYDSACTFGKRITVEQIKYLLKYKVTDIDLCWDGPSEKEPNGAYVEMLYIAPLLSQLFNLRVVFLPKGDPGDYSREEMSKFREKSINFSDKNKEKSSLNVLNSTIISK